MYRHNVYRATKRGSRICRLCGRDPEGSRRHDFQELAVEYSNSLYDRMYVRGTCTNGGRGRLVKHDVFTRRRKNGSTLSVESYTYGRIRMVVYVWSYTYGRKHGMFIVYWKNGNMKTRRIYSSGVKHTAEKWRRNGTKKYRRHLDVNRCIEWNRLGMPTRDTTIWLRHGCVVMWKNLRLDNGSHVMRLPRDVVYIVYHRIYRIYRLYSIYSIHSIYITFSISRLEGCTDTYALHLLRLFCARRAQDELRDYV